MRPAPTLANLQEISSPALVAMVVAAVIVVLDGLASPSIVLIGLLAIAPVIAATSASVPETGLVGGFCAVMAILSGLWNENIGSSVYVVEVLTVLAGAVAGLLVASLREDLNRENAVAELFVELGGLMEDALGQRERAEHVTELAVPTLSDVAIVDILAEDGSIERLAAFSGGSEVAELFVKLRRNVPIAPKGPHPVATVIRTGEPQEMGALPDERIEEITTEESERVLLRKHRFHSCLVLPLRARGAVLGAITLWILRPSLRFDEPAKRAARRLAQRAALALDNARLHEQQAHIAGVLQESLRPRSLPEIPGFILASRFEAAGEAYEVGGDFYDAFRTGSGSWTIVIGDVCGKGPEAAALTSLARFTVRTAAGPRSSPSAVLRSLHDSISAESPELRFCTAALLRLDPPANGRGNASLTVALGGHPPPLVLRRDGRVQLVGKPGTLLGAIADPELADTGARLAKGDALVLYTDGMLERRHRARGDDPDWLMSQLSKLAGKSPNEIAKRLTAAAIRRQGGEPRDDIAVLVLGRRGRS